MRSKQVLWGRLVTCGRLAIGLKSFLHSTRRIANPPQVTNLPHMMCCFLIAACLCATASAQQYGLPAMVRGVGIDQNLNAQVPLELTFKNETGQIVRLGQYFRTKPVVLALVYYECPMLCDMVLNGLTHSMEGISLDVGKDYEVVTVSFNPKDTWQLAGPRNQITSKSINARARLKGGISWSAPKIPSRNWPTPLDSTTSTIRSRNNSRTPAASWC